MNYSKKSVRKKQQALHSTSKKWSRKIAFTFVQVFLIGMVGMAIIGVSAGIGAFRGILASAPEIGNIDVTPSGFSTFVYDIEGNQTAKLVAKDANRIPVTIDTVPQDLKDAFVAIEDARFYDHNGIDIKGIIRAGVVGIQNRHFSEGASTITQQLLKNNVFTDWTSEDSLADKFKRKFQEQYLALELEKVMDKETILINYMNTINLGSNTLGVEAASRRYFGKHVNELNLSECAVIAGITQNPSRFNPTTHPEKNAERREKVLNNMLDQGYITNEEYEEALADDVYSRIQIADAENEDNAINTYFVDALTDDVMEDLIAAGYNETQAYTLLYSGGLKIYSTQDPKIQAICDSAFADESNFPANTKWYLNYELTIDRANGDRENISTEMFRSYWRENRSSSYNLIYASQEEAYQDIEAYKADVMGSGDEVYGENVSLTPQPQVSLVVEDQKTGCIVAMEGGRGAKTASRTLNRATDTMRQPGSTFKIVSSYAPALDSAGLTLATVINDAPFNYAGGRPVANWYGEQYRGLSSLRDGIRDSMNIVTVDLTELTRNLLVDWIPVFEDAQMDFVADIPERPFRVELDPDGYMRILNNLVQNVISHSHGNRIEIALLEQDGNIKIRLADNGSGIDKEDLKHIFERLYKCDKGRSEKGSGLGLSIVHQLVIKMNGTITAESVPGSGTIFTLSFPLVEEKSVTVHTGLCTCCKVRTKVIQG